MDVTSYLLGKNAGGGSEPTGTITITENGTHNVKDYASAEVNVPTGGGIQEKDVNFYDYDGTLVDAYSKNEFLQLTEMPETPTNEGLTSQGWNWTLSDAKSYVTECGMLQIGNVCLPSDDKIHIFVELDNNTLSPYLNFAVSGTATIDWGDRNTQDITGSSTSTIINTQHNYSRAGNYEITISSNSTIYLKGAGASYPLLITKATSTQEYDPCADTIKKIYLNNNVNLATYCLCALKNVETITLPTSVNFPNSLCQYCLSLKSVIIPPGKYLSGYGYQYCTNLKVVCLSKNSIYSQTNSFNYCVSLEKICIDGKYTSSIMNTCTNLNKVAIRTTETTLPGDFNNCHRIEYFKIPSQITTSVSGSVLRYSAGLRVVDFRDVTSVYTLKNYDFSGGNNSFIFVVPDNLYETWIASSGWENYVYWGRVIKASDYNE